MDVREPTDARVPVAVVQNLVNQVKREPFEASLTELTSFPTRHSTSESFAEAATWAQNQLNKMNYKTQVQTFTVGDGISRNIIADKPGADDGTRNVVIVTANLDSINVEGGAAVPAPGADANGSGSAGLLEIARVFQDHRGRHDLRLILFGGKEQGLFGSKHYVAGLSASERARIRAVVNMDMIGSVNGSSRSVLLEGAPLSQRIIDELSQAAVTYTHLTVETSLSPFSSDHVAFIAAGLPAVLTSEGADSANRNIHSSRDTIDKIDYDLALEILRMNIAYVASELAHMP
jgi:Zn-dependent M28 family amino/carboxypeptidase